MSTWRQVLYMFKYKYFRTVLQYNFNIKYYIMATSAISISASEPDDDAPTYMLPVKLSQHDVG